MRRTPLLPIIVVLLAAAALVAALLQPVQPVQPVPAEVPRWRDVSAGLVNHTLVNNLIVNPTDSRNAYAATYDDSGFYRTNDGGATWRSAERGLDGFAGYALAIAPNKPRTLLLGTAGGIYRSDDAGGSWRKLWPRESKSRVVRGAIEASRLTIYALAYSPLDGRTIYAGRYGGILVSTDDGATWSEQPLDFPAEYPTATILSLAFSRNGRTLYAGTNGLGLLRSRDNGRTWMQIYPTRLVVSQVIVASNDEVFARIQNQVTRSQNQGDSWLDLDGTPHDVFTVVEHNGLPVIYTGNRKGIQHSIDGGLNWTPAGLEGRSISGLAGSGGRLYAVTPNGIWVNNEETWHLPGSGLGKPLVRALLLAPDGKPYVGTSGGLYTGTPGAWKPTGVTLSNNIVRTIALAPNDPQTLYTGVWEGGIYRSRDAGISWENVAREQYTNAQIPQLLIDMKNANRIYARVEFDRIISSQDGAQSWKPLDRGLEGVTCFSLIADPQNSGRLYTGTDQGIYRKDGDDDWKQIVDGAPFERGTVFALAVDPHDSQKMYAGATNGIHVSIDGGATWLRPASSPNVTIATLLIDPQNLRRIWAGGRYSGVYRSEDAGMTWTFIGPALPPGGILGSSGVTVGALVYDPASRTLYAGTDTGLWALEETR